MGHENTIIVWKANRAILSSVFNLPPDRNIISIPPKEEDDANKSKITKRSKMTIFDGERVIIFDDNKVSVRQYGDRQRDDRAVIYYLIYKTFLNYNCLSPEKENTEFTPEVNTVSFKLHRYITKHVEEDGKTISCIDTEPCEIVLNKKDITDYLTVIDETIFYAICYYLLGCDTQRYFLIEFYKCLEVINSHFENEKKMTRVLKPHGFLGQVYKEARRLANDRRNPLSIARHAPYKGASFQSIDTKWLFSDPIGRKAFETGEKACRNMIDSYLQFRAAVNP
ncbi:MAG: hypothetical protein KAT56_03740 [Sedimentisphaerales bacterium]|nr:hypothetical protein [Sedimentisphaerales bacterium]